MSNVLNFLKSQVGKGASESASPLMQWLNPTITNVEQGLVEMELTVRKDLCNPLNQLHGGVSAAIIDDSIGVAMYSYGDPVFHPSINLSVDFFSNVKIDAVVVIRARVLKKGKKLSNALCEIFHKDTNRIVARGTVNLLSLEV